MQTRSRVADAPQIDPGVEGALVVHSIDEAVALAGDANEMMVILVMTTGPRVHNRAGGLAAQDIKGEDGLR